ncbi:uncharacterized protein LOC113314966 isoform X2 [Papaver somniferum]|uniref:uncharacterized protein LOC113314966 isoform X2 n=1 Tax=Papaver somniferum TaxID=3469 RepID=UPI000E6F9BE4|nr:uncharacterized protein LOC113314966 isoform X2 [Papaver somniferum]
MVLSGSMSDSDNSIWDSDESLTSDCDSENSSTYTKRLLDMDEVVEDAQLFAIGDDVTILLFVITLEIGESTAVECLKRFCDAIIGIYEKEYLRKPNENDIARLLKEAEIRGFPGMIGSLDYMHWHWENCPTAWHGTHTNGFKRVPTLILEAVASQNLWIWHAFFGMAGTNNDINVLDRSPLFDDIINGVAPPCEFAIQGNDREELFSKRQEAVRKDVERAFGVLQSRW